MGQELKKVELRRAIEKHYAPFEYRHTGRSAFQQQEQERRAQLEEYKQRKNTEVDSCWEAITAQWPCERPVISGESLYPYLNREGILKDCGSLFTCWYRNRQFLDFIQQVQNRLNAIQASQEPLVEPLPCPPARGPVHHGLPFQPPTLLELIRSSAPTVVPPDPPSFTCPRPRIPQFCHTERHSALRSLIHLSFNDASVHRREYKDDLLQSVGALERSVLPYRPTAIPITRDTLSDYQASLRQQRDVVWSSFVSALTSTESSWKAVGGATLWPSITVAAVLSLLAVDKWPSVPECWKHAILMFAKVIASLRRCDRLLTFFDKSDINGFTKEVETAECEGWELANNPDWVLFEIENNLTIRPQQAEIAQRIIGSESEGNFALQLNMGEGKTSVITPMVASRIADYPQIPRIVVLKPLLRQSVDLLSQGLGGLLNRPIYHIPFLRNTPMNEHSVDQLQSIYRNCQDQKGILIALPEQILSFRLIGLDMAHESNNLARRMIQLEKWLQSNCRNIVYECDEILDPKFQLIYAMGNQQPMDSHSDRWEITQAVLGVVEEEAIKLHSEEPNSLDIECNGVRYPIFHFLKAETVDVLLQNTLEVICKKQLPGIPFDSWGHSVRESAFRFIRYVDTTDSDQAVLRGAFGSSDIVFRRLLILRGLFAHRILRFTLGFKRWLVDYGLHLPRCLLAVPFRAKGVPSENAEFGHPDVALTLTCMSYYYEGLTVDQVQHCFGILTKENDPEAEYQRWIARCSGSLPDALHSQSGVNLEDTQSFLKYLYPHLQYQKALVDFYLSHVAFPRGAKEFPRKLSTSAWDIPSQSSLPPTTGFSGTNDNRSLLPRSMPQRDLPRLRHTSAMVLDHLMLEENRQCILAQDSTGRQLRTDELITLVNRQEPPARVIIDVGAQILERSNRSVAENWLSTLPPNSADAAVFYDFNDEAVVVDRGGYTERLLTSTFRRQMDRCLVFLDQHHARGVDLKLPLKDRAAITLGPRLTKDRLVQACSRMRELGNGQSVMFFIPPEVIHSMTPTHGHFTSCDVIQWALNQTFQTLESFRPLWAWQGLHHHRRTRLWEDLLADENTLREIVLRMQEPEAQTLLQLYAPWEAKQSTLENDPDLDHSSADVQYLLDMWQNVTEGNAGEFRMHEEQEGEIAVEVEREQQVCRPRLAKPLDHSLHPDIQHYAKHGRFQFGTSSKAICSAFESFRQTSAGQFPVLSKLGHHLYATLDFTQTIREVAGTTNDEFMKPVLWILSSSHSPNLVIISQYEVNKLLPDIRATENTALHIYSPRTSKGMRRFNDLDFFTVGKANTNCPPLPEISRDLELFAGSLYFDSFPDYQHFRHFLGLKTGYVGDVPEDSVSPEGFVDEEARQVVGWPVRSPFRSNPLPFLSAVFDIRGKGHGYLQTHVGSLIKGMPLSEDEF